MKTQAIIDSSIIGRRIELMTSELFAIYNLITKLEVMAKNTTLDYDKENINKTIGLLSNIIDKNAIESLLYGHCSDIFEYHSSTIDPATLADQEQESKYLH